MASRYLIEHAELKKKPRSVYEDRRILDRYILPCLGNHKVANVTSQDVDRLHASMKSTPVMANRMVFLLSAMMNLAERWKLRPFGSNPCRGLERYRERKRHHFLSDAELARLGQTLAEAERTGAESSEVIGALRLLVLTGARRGEILGLRWQNVDFQRAALTLPDSETGQKVIPLSAPAMQVLDSLPRRSAWVFPSGRTGRSMPDLNGPWRRIRSQARLDGVRLHDLRHTHASVGAGAGLSLPLIGSLLGHSQASTTQRYAHLLDDPRRDAAERVGARITADLEGFGQAEVLPLPRSARHA